MKSFLWLLACVAMLIILSTGMVFSAEKVFFYHTDATGTPLAMTDEDGNVVWEADYKPFGEEQEVTPYPENNKMFIGKEKDQETGLYYFGARYMDAGIGRFTTPDPKGISESDLMNPQRLNRYNYSLNNPYRYVDPDGRTPWDLVDIGFFSYSLYKFVDEPSWSTAGDLGLDTVGLLPIVPSLGIIKRVGEGVNKIDNALDTVKGGSKLMADPFAKQLERQLAKNGPKSINKSLKSMEKRLAEHEAKLQTLERKSSVKREIRTFKKQIETIKEFKKIKGLE